MQQRGSEIEWEWVIDWREGERDKILKEGDGWSVSKERVGKGAGIKC